MKNTIQVIDPPSKPIDIYQIKFGEMFRYAANRSADSGIYMRLYGKLVEDNTAVYLPTGEVYPISTNAELVPVKALTITSVD